MDPRRPSWLDEMPPEPPTSNKDVLTPPSSYVLQDGNDWNTHVGSLFGEQMPSAFEVDEQLRDDGHNNIFDQAMQMTTLNNSTEIDMQQSNTPSNNWQDFNNQDMRSNSITLQDLIKSDQVDAVYPYIEAPWDVEADRMDAVSSAPSHLQASDVSVGSPWDMDAHFNGYTRSNTDGLTDGGECNEPCYARLLYRCLKEAPDHTLSLKHIYRWIRENTQRARDPTNKGWQNSVRHNLSMNAAFERVTMTGDVQTKKGSLWRLTNDAIHRGVISTTRYRRDPKRKAARRGAPALKRQMSGAKGGAATRAASHARRARELQNRSYMLQGGQRFFTTPPESTAVTPVHMQSAFQQPQMATASPYFNHVQEAWPTQSLPLSAPQPQAQYCFPQVPYDGQQDFGFRPLRSGQRLFCDIEEECAYTPSLATDSSVYTDDGSRSHTAQPHSELF